MEKTNKTSLKKTFGQRLRFYRNSTKDENGRSLSLERMAGLMDSYRYPITFQTLSNWEKDQTLISHKDRLAFVTLIKVLTLYQGLPIDKLEMDEWLAVGEYRALDDSEWQDLLTFWGSKKMALPTTQASVSAQAEPASESMRVQKTEPIAPLLPPTILDILRKQQGAFFALWQGKLWRELQINHFFHAVILLGATLLTAQFLIKPIFSATSHISQLTVLQFCLAYLVASLMVVCAIQIGFPASEFPQQLPMRLRWMLYQLQGTSLGVAIGFFLSMVALSFWRAIALEMPSGLFVLASGFTIALSLWAGVNVPINVYKWAGAFDLRKGAVFWIPTFVPPAIMLALYNFPELLSVKLQPWLFVGAALLGSLLTLLENRKGHSVIRPATWTLLWAVVLTPQLFLYSPPVFASAVLCLWLIAVYWLYQGKIVLTLSQILLWLGLLLVAQVLGMWNPLLSYLFIVLIFASIWLFTRTIGRLFEIPKLIWVVLLLWGAILWVSSFFPAFAWAFSGLGLVFSALLVYWERRHSLDVR
jgi:hypothetical protein